MPPHRHPSLPCSRIVLVGFMGAGKSTVGPLLAGRLGWNFADADRHIEQQASATVAQIFEQQGEPAFRRMEAQAIELLLQMPRHVVALGGGALESAETRDRLQNDGGSCLIYLEAPVHVLLARCEQQQLGQPVRPLLEEMRGEQDRFGSSVAQKLAARLPSYRAAHLTVDTTDLTAGQVVDRIVSDLDERGIVRTEAGEAQQQIQEQTQ